MGFRATPRVYFWAFSIKNWFHKKVFFRNLSLRILLPIVTRTKPLKFKRKIFLLYQDAKIHDSNAYKKIKNLVIITRYKDLVSSLSSSLPDCFILFIHHIYKFLYLRKKRSHKFFWYFIVAVKTSTEKKIFFKCWEKDLLEDF